MHSLPLAQTAAALASLSHPNILGAGGIIAQSLPRMLIHDDVMTVLSLYIAQSPVEGALLRKCALEVAQALQYLDKYTHTHTHTHTHTLTHTLSQTAYCAR